MNPELQIKAYNCIAAISNIWSLIALSLGPAPSTSTSPPSHLLLESNHSSSPLPSNCAAVLLTPPCGSPITDLGMNPKVEEEVTTRPEEVWRKLSKLSTGRG